MNATLRDLKSLNVAFTAVAAWLGTAVLLRAPDAAAARAVLTVDRYAAVEVHSWRFGGRPS